MSAQLLELLFFAIIAFFVITKLISILGITNENDQAKNRRSFFGENGGMKDVTDNLRDNKNVIEVSFQETQHAADADLDKLIVHANKESILKGLAEARNLLPTFNPANFLKGAKVAFQMIIEAKSDKELAELVDKRYLEQYKAIQQSYGTLLKLDRLEASIEEIYTFGNNIFVKILFLGKKILDNVENFHEEWTFTKNTLQNGPEWYLTNIDRAQ